MSELKENAHIEALKTAKKGCNVKVILWTNACASSMVTHAKSITAAMKIVRAHHKSYANWKLEFLSEGTDYCYIEDVISKIEIDVGMPEWPKGRFS